MGEPVTIHEIVERVCKRLTRDTGVKWKSEPWGKRTWGVYTDEHWKYCRDLNGHKFPLAVYSMIRERNNNEKTLAFWKTIEWRDTEMETTPDELKHRDLMNDWQVDFSRCLHRIPLKDPFFDSQFSHIKRIGKGHGMSRSAVICEREWVNLFMVPIKDEGWGMNGSISDFTNEFKEFALWGWQEMQDFVQNLPEKV